MSVSQEIHPTEVLGPITARQAFALAEGELKRRNMTVFRFTFISAGEHIDQRGYSIHWELFFELPESAELVIVTMEPQGDAWEDRQPALSISLTRKPWLVKESRPALPRQFRDSPEAVTALAEQGADWISGNTQMTLSTRFTGKGKFVWHTETYGGVLETGFSESE